LQESNDPSSSSGAAALIDAFLAKLRARDDVSAAEEAAIKGAVADVQTVPDRHILIRRKEELTVSTLLLDGWMARARDLRAGHRQITELHIAGDFVDLHSFTLKQLDHEIITLSQCRIAVVPHENLRKITEEHPHLTRVLWLMTDIDAAIHREWGVSVARRSALSRIAHLMCELLLRLRVIGRASDAGYDFPLSQAELSECVGLTPVHTNRTLQEMRRRGLIELVPGKVTILDLEALKTIGEFDPMYLYLDRRSR
jgi:CRP-like cAMP-binding protein